MPYVFRRYRFHYTQSEFRRMMLFSSIFFMSSMVAIFFAIGYATDSASNPVTDIVLSNIPAFAVGDLFVYGSLLMALLTALVCFAHPNRTPFALNALALFWIIRSGFVSLTHLGPSPIQTPINFDFNLGIVATRFLTGNDLFFSGHVGWAFLLALLFWNEKTLRYIFLAWSVFFVVVVLLGHIHYSIDVASAFFITYGIYHLALWLFPREHKLFVSS